MHLRLFTYLLQTETIVEFGIMQMRQIWQCPTMCDPVHLMATQQTRLMRVITVFDTYILLDNVQNMSN